MNNFDTNLDLKMINHILVLLSKGLSNYGRSLYDRVDQFKRNQKCYLTNKKKEKGKKNRWYFFELSSERKKLYGGCNNCVQVNVRHFTFY